MGGVLLLVFYIILGIFCGAYLFAGEESWLRKLWE